MLSRSSRPRLQRTAQTRSSPKPWLRRLGPQGRRRQVTGRSGHRVRRRHDARLRIATSPAPIAKIVPPFAGIKAEQELETAPTQSGEAPSQTGLEGTGPSLVLDALRWRSIVAWHTRRSESQERCHRHPLNLVLGTLASRHRQWEGRGGRRSQGGAVVLPAGL